MPPRAERHARHARAAGLRRLPPLSLRTSRRALARAEILTAAAELFRARGYRTTTLEELARRLGISKKTLYGHFRSKEDLLAALPVRLRRAIVRRKARYDHAVQAIVRRCGPLAVHPRLVVFALLGMSNWTHKWYDPRGRWDAEFIAEAFIALIERGYVASPAARRRDVARRLDGLHADVRSLRAMLRGR